MDLGARRGLRREKLRREHGPAAAIFKNETSAACLALTMVFLGTAIGGFGHAPIAIALDRRVLVAALQHWLLLALLILWLV